MDECFLSGLVHCKDASQGSECGVPSRTAVVPYLGYHLLDLSKLGLQQLGACAPVLVVCSMVVVTP